MGVPIMYNEYFITYGIIVITKFLKITEIRLIYVKPL